MFLNLVVPSGASGNRRPVAREGFQPPQGGLKVELGSGVGHLAPLRQQITQTTPL